ncbi:hypothetical protein ACQ9AR_33455 [Streptomyces lividans]|uniref:hypothetical protein n=1 Tax=Streptomyces sp. WM6391 TaxID=1415559 RepID=UPI000ACBA597|nr:hypothetical protein [Streptomyces sp. WM6391]
MAVIGVLREPTPPTWWQANRHKVFGVAGLLLGYVIGSHYPGATDQQPQHPRPGHNTPAPTAPGRTPEALVGSTA